MHQSNQKIIMLGNKWIKKIKMRKMKEMTMKKMILKGNMLMLKMKMMMLTKKTMMLNMKMKIMQLLLLKKKILMSKKKVKKGIGLNKKIKNQFIIFVMGNHFITFIYDVLQ